MLHEVLLALCGYPSPLFESNGINSFPLVTPAESALLRRLGHLASLHRALRNHVTRLVQVHEVLVCKAVGTAIRQNHLARFQKHVLQVEAQILSKDASRVGAYNIVPLASLMGEFEPWIRTLEWLWDLSCFIFPLDAHDDMGLANRSGADLLERLRQDSMTGYPDIRAAALDLLAVAESSWLRQLVHWLLQTAQGTTGTTDFFIETTVGSNQSLSFTAVSTRAPSFVSEASAESILYLGKMLNYTSRDWEGSKDGGPMRRSKIDTLDLAQHLRCLNSLKSPIVPSNLASVISDIRTSLSLQTINKLLPTHKVLETIALMREFFLLGKPSFADSLIIESDSFMQLRATRIMALQASRLDTSLAGITLKESEVSQVVARALASLVPWVGKEASLDSDMEWARDNLRMQLVKEQGAKDESRFHDLLLGTPASLTIQLRSPLDLFISPEDIDDYSSMQTYLLSIRRGHLHLSELWRQTTLRKEHPSPKGAHESASSQRIRFQTRMRHLRSVWQAIGTTRSVLAELGQYMAVEVVRQSWTRLLAWLGDGLAEDNLARPSSAISDQMASIASLDNRPNSRAREFFNKSKALRDPETIFASHRSYLQSLRRAFLLEDDAYTGALRNLLSHADYLVATFNRLIDVQRRVDLIHEGVVEQELHDYRREEQSLTEDVVQAAKQLDTDVKALWACLHAINAERIKPGFQNRDRTIAADEFTPWDSTLDRLLLRLDRSAVDGLP